MKPVVKTAKVAKNLCNATLLYPLININASVIQPLTQSPPPNWMIGCKIPSTTVNASLE